MGELREWVAVLAWRPEWPAAVVAALAWLAVVLWPPSSGVHGLHARAPAALDETTAPAVGGWTLMCIAMMWPATLPAVRHVALNSLRRRRLWAMAVYLGAYCAVWVAFGVVALALIATAGAYRVGSLALVATMLVVGAAWQTTRWKRRAIFACRRTVPLPPVGRRADAGCAIFGLRQAGRGAMSSWPLMLLMAVVGHGNLLAMAALSCIVVTEERRIIRGRLRCRVAVLIGFASLGIALLFGAG